MKDLSEKKIKNIYKLHSLRPPVAAESISQDMSTNHREKMKNVFIEERNKNMEDLNLISLSHVCRNHL